jgi:glycine cleavage system transcriptional repressor
LFTLEGADHPGIVHKVTTILSNNGLSIEKMETSDEIAPHGGTMLFKISGIAHAYEPLAAGFDVSKLKQELSSLGDDMNCDISMQDVAEDEYQGTG